MKAETKNLVEIKYNSPVASMLLRIKESIDCDNILSQYPTLNPNQRDIAEKALCFGYNCMSKRDVLTILRLVFLKDITLNTTKELIEQFWSLGKALSNMNNLSSLSTNYEVDTIKYMLELHSDDYTKGNKLSISKAKELENMSDEELLKIVGDTNE